LCLNDVVYEEIERKKCLAMKVIFEKAYDSIIWDFIYYMFERLVFSFSFCKKWINWIDDV